jgi:hypothetical protein
MQTAKKTLLAIVALLCLQVEASAFEPNTASNARFEITTNTNSLIGRRKGYRKKRGFMWGLFKKKNACNCPKH